MKMLKWSCRTVANLIFIFKQMSTKASAEISTKKVHLPESLKVLAKDPV